MHQAAGDKRTGDVSWEQDIRPSDATYLAEKYNAPMLVDNSVWQASALTYSTFMMLNPGAADGGDREAESDSDQHGGNDADEHEHSSVAIDSSPSKTKRMRAAEESLERSCQRAGVLCALGLIGLCASMLLMTLLPVCALDAEHVHNQMQCMQPGSDPVCACPVVPQVTGRPPCRDKDPEVIKMIKRSMAVAIAEENYKEAARLRDMPAMATYREIQELRAEGDLPAAIQLQDELAHQEPWSFDSSI